MLLLSIAYSSYVYIALKTINKFSMSYLSKCKLIMLKVIYTTLRNYECEFDILLKTLYNLWAPHFTDCTPQLIVSQINTWRKLWYFLYGILYIHSSDRFLKLLRKYWLYHSKFSKKWNNNVKPYVLVCCPTTFTIIYRTIFFRFKLHEIT
jgi:hypothetical protein